MQFYVIVRVNIRAVTVHLSRSKRMELVFQPFIAAQSLRCRENSTDTVSQMQGKQHDTISSFDVAGNQATQAGVVDFTFNYIQYIIRVPIPGIMLQRNTN